MNSCEISDFMRLNFLLIPIFDQNLSSKQQSAVREQIQRIFGFGASDQIVYTMNCDEFIIQTWNTSQIGLGEGTMPFACRFKDVVIVARFEDGTISKRDSKCEKKQKTDKLNNGNLTGTVTDALYENSTKKNQNNLVHIKQKKPLQYVTDKNFLHVQQKIPENLSLSHIITNGGYYRSMMCDLPQEKQPKKKKIKSNTQYTNQQITKIVKKFNKKCTIIFTYINISHAGTQLSQSRDYCIHPDDLENVHTEFIANHSNKIDYNLLICSIKDHLAPNTARKHLKNQKADVNSNFMKRVVGNFLSEVQKSMSSTQNSSDSSIVIKLRKSMIYRKSSKNQLIEKKKSVQPNPEKQKVVIKKKSGSFFGCCFSKIKQMTDEKKIQPYSSGQIGLMKKNAVGPVVN